MFYVIDFDSREVESKSKDKELLAAYIVDNGLDQAVALIDSADELCLQFSIGEMKDLYSNITNGDCKFDDEEQLSEIVWDILNNHQTSFPEFTPSLGKKLVKAASKESKSDIKPSKPKAAKATRAPIKRISLNREDPICYIEGKAKTGSILNTIIIAIEDELCGTVGEVIDYITSNHVIPKTGDLADVKFAEHNIKYFVKKGNIALEEGL